MRLRARLDKLKGKSQEACAIHMYLYDLEEDLVTGPDGQRMTAAEAELRQRTSALVIDLRRRP